MAQDWRLAIFVIASFARRFRLTANPAAYSLCISEQTIIQNIGFIHTLAPRKNLNPAGNATPN